jgi:hypothetical protein
MSNRSRAFPRVGAPFALPQNRFPSHWRDSRLSYRAAFLAMGTISALLWTLIILTVVKLT